MNAIEVRYAGSRFHEGGMGCAMRRTAELGGGRSRRGVVFLVEISHACHAVAKYLIDSSVGNANACVGPAGACEPLRLAN
jgi:hypothetical protein